jgi:preprotein translocase subunit YajC
MDPISLIVMVGLIFGLMWLMTSSQRKRAKAQEELRRGLTPGQQVMTGMGLYGTVVEVDDDGIMLEVSPGVVTKWHIGAVSRLVESPLDEGADEDGDDDDEPLDDEYIDEEYDDLDEDDEDLDVEVPDDASSLIDDDDIDDDDIDDDDEDQNEDSEDEDSDGPGQSKSKR